MKTLDDVITALEEMIGQSGVENESEGYFLALDSIHYLKEYRQTRQGLLDGMKRLEEKEMMFIHAMADTENNHPLSWEELKSMKGKPVWVELNSEYGNFSHWGIIRNFLKIGREFEYMELLGYYDIVSFSVIKEDQGKKWQAYRKEKDEVAE